MVSIITIIAAALLFPPAIESTPYPDIDTLFPAKLQAPGEQVRPATQKVQQTGEISFQHAVAAMKKEQWQQAADYFGLSAATYPLLSDYALYYRSVCLHRLSKDSEALDALDLLATMPPSPVSRPAGLLSADILFSQKKYDQALLGYQNFIANSPPGTDITVRFQVAYCQEIVGKLAEAAAAYRDIWINYPATKEARLAEENLRNLTAGSFNAFKPEELLARSLNLQRARRYNAALESLKNIPLAEASSRIVQAVSFRKGQILLDARRYKDAEEVLAAISGKELTPEEESIRKLLLARAKYRNGKEQEAVADYLEIAKGTSNPELKTKTLLSAASILNSIGKTKEAIPLLDRVAASSRNSWVRAKALWEIGWSYYQKGDFTAAAEVFSKLAVESDLRDTALYWLARTQERRGDQNAAEKAWKELLDEYPLGYYALRHKQEKGFMETIPSLPSVDVRELLPSPSGYARVKALISFGLVEDAKKEISFNRSDSTKTVRFDLVRLYLDMGDYHAAMALFPRDGLRQFDAENPIPWAVNYPCGYREEVIKMAASKGLKESLVFSIIRQESSYLPQVVSPAGAVGLMQVMPATAKSLIGGTETAAAQRLCQPEMNIQLGVRHLANLVKLYNGNLTLAIAAYNAGSGNVERWRKNFGNLPEDEFIENIPFAETREYVKKVEAGMGIYSILYRLDKPQCEKIEVTSENRSLAPGTSNSY